MKGLGLGKHRFTFRISDRNPYPTKIEPYEITSEVFIWPWQSIYDVALKSKKKLIPVGIWADVDLVKIEKV